MRGVGASVPAPSCIRKSPDLAAARWHCATQVTENLRHETRSFGATVFLVSQSAFFVRNSFITTYDPARRVHSVFLAHFPYIRFNKHSYTHVEAEWPG